MQGRSFDNMGPNELAWLRIDQELHIGDAVREDGALVVPMEDIKRVGKREIRFLLKQDRRSQVPSFLDGGGCMSISNSDVLFYNNDLHQTLPTPTVVDHVNVHNSSLPALIDPWLLSSEPEAIGVVETLGGLNQFTVDNLVPRSTGRHKIFKPFEMKLHGTRIGASIPITNPQVESDGWWIGDYAGYALEAKMGKSNELHRRQLFYQYHDLYSRLNDQNSDLDTKILSLISRGEGVYDLYEFEFRDEFDILSCEVLQSKRIHYHRVEQNKLQIHYAEHTPNYSAPFPQADDLGLVLKTFDWIASGYGLYEWIFETGYDKRQFDYYFNASKWLNLFDGNSSNPVLTSFGEQFKLMSKTDRKNALGSILVSDYVFANCTEVQPENIRSAATDLILEKGEKYRVQTRITADRRAQTVKAWIVSLGLHG